MRKGEGKPVVRSGNGWVGLEWWDSLVGLAARRNGFMEEPGWEVVEILPNSRITLDLMASTEFALECEQNDVTRILLEHSSEGTDGWYASKPWGSWLIRKFSHDGDRAKSFRSLQIEKDSEDLAEEFPDMTTDSDIQGVLDGLGAMLQAKRASYGDSVGKPIGIFHKGSPVDGILARIDDKLGRVKTGSLMWNDEDVIEDLLGYLVLLKIARGR